MEIKEVLHRLELLDYQTLDELRESCEKEYGLDYEEALEMAYDNLLMDVRHLISVIKKSPK